MICILRWTGGLGVLPDASVLADGEVLTFAEGGRPTEPAGRKVADALAALEGKGCAGEGLAGGLPRAQVTVGPGLASLPARLVEDIRANKFIDFSELPPAKGKGRNMPQALEGQVVVIQATDLMQSRRIIPDLATWTQCFAIYVAVIAQKQPERVPELMAYQSLVAKVSLKYKWPAWVVYDQNFRAEVAGKTDQSWAKVDAGIYTQCFTGQAISTENWCGRCQCLDHASQNCPYNARKRSWSAASGQQQPHSSGSGPSASDQTCFKYNRFNGDCRFGRQCRFRHVCSGCGEPHPVSRCKRSPGGPGKAAA